MPLIVSPTIDDRTYQDILDDLTARIPVHNPEWTNFNRSDPGITLVELFAFLAENVLYRANQIPERNRRKFLSLLGVPLQPGASARGLVTFTNDRGPLETVTLSQGLEVRAGEVPFRTEQTIDVLPIETRVYYKRERLNPSTELKEYYRQLYSSYRTDPAPPDLKLYDTVAFMAEGNTIADLGDAIDRSLWIALLVRSNDKQDLGLDQAFETARAAIEHKTLSLGLVPVLSAGSRDLRAGQTTPEGMPLVQYLLPSVPAGGNLPKSRIPEYRALPATPDADVLAMPGVVSITLPSKSDLTLWQDLDPLDAGVGDFPPSVEDTAIEDRVITWLRVRPAGGAPARMLWAGINAVRVGQRAAVLNELLTPGTGEPDQVITLARQPVIPGTVTISVAGFVDPWVEIDDLYAAGAEVPSPDPRTPPGAPRPPAAATNVFVVDPESGAIQFGDGTHGRRPPADAVMRATYDYGMGPQGNVGPAAITASPALPAFLKVANPVRTWGGAAPEPVLQGEKQISAYLRHRDRLVTADDFKTIAERTPGVDIGRVDVLPAYNPALAGDEPGGAPGAVTLLVVPRYDPDQPDAPRPDPLFLDAICAYLDPRRLITTEVFLRGPEYKPIWISIGIKPIGGVSVPQVREAVKQELLDFLAPLDRDRPATDDIRRFVAWPLRKSVVDRELMAVASRVAGVRLVTNVIVAEGDKPASSEIEMDGLQLPRVMGISVVDGDPVDIGQLRGTQTTPADRPPVSFVPVPIIPEEC
jgi:hypothetical protein